VRIAIFLLEVTNKQTEDYKDNLDRRTSRLAELLFVLRLINNSTL
jgi:hypothetical protein